MAEIQLDLDVMERNAQRMATEIESLGKMWRPHMKSHRQPRLAKYLIELGAGGVTCANVNEVEVMADAGIPSILLAHITVNENTLDRLAAVTRKTELLVMVDHFVQAELLSRAAERNAVTFNVLIDVDIGMHRTGCRPRVDACQLAVATSELAGLSISGVVGYEGHLLGVPDENEKKTQIFESMNMLEQSRDAMLEKGIPCDIVSAGGSGSFWITGQHEAVTELQAGGGIFGDLFYQKTCGLKGVESALTVVGDVISRPALAKAVTNCGQKAINPAVHPPEPMNLPGATIDYMSAEHTVLTLEPEARDLKIGDTVRFAVGYSDLTILEHQDIHVYRGGEKVETWTVIR